MASAALLLLLLLLLVFLLLLSADGVKGGVVLPASLEAASLRSRVTAISGGVQAQPGIPGALKGYANSVTLLGSPRQEGGRWRCAEDSGCWGRSLLPPQARFDSFDAWLNAFMYTLKRDTILNVAKIGGIILLYYLAPGVLLWASDTFG